MSQLPNASRRRGRPKRIAVKVGGDEWQTVLSDVTNTSRCQDAARLDAREALLSVNEDPSIVREVLLTAEEEAVRVTFFFTSDISSKVKSCFEQSSYYHLQSCYSSLLSLPPLEPSIPSVRPTAASNPNRLIAISATERKSPVPRSGSQQQKVVQEDGCCETARNADITLDRVLCGDTWRRLVDTRQDECSEAAQGDMEDFVRKMGLESNFTVAFPLVNSDVHLQCFVTVASASQEEVEREFFFYDCKRLNRLYEEWMAACGEEEERGAAEQHAHAASTIESLPSLHSLVEKSIVPFRMPAHVAMITKSPSPSPPPLQTSSFAKESAARKADTSSDDGGKRTSVRDLSVDGRLAFLVQFEGEAWGTVLLPFKGDFITAFKRDVTEALSCEAQSQKLDVSFHSVGTSGIAHLQFGNLFPSSLASDLCAVMNSCSFSEVWRLYNKLLGCYEPLKPNFTLLLSGSEWPRLLEKSGNVLHHAALHDAYVALQAEGDACPPKIDVSITLQGDHARLTLAVDNSDSGPDPSRASKSVSVWRKFSFPSLWSAYHVLSQPMTPTRCSAKMLLLESHYCASLINSDHAVLPAPRAPGNSKAVQVTDRKRDCASVSVQTCFSATAREAVGELEVSIPPVNRFERQNPLVWKRSEGVVRTASCKVGFPGKEWPNILDRKIDDFITAVRADFLTEASIGDLVVDEIFADEVYGIISVVRTADSNSCLRELVRSLSFPAVWKLYDAEKFFSIPKLKSSRLPPVEIDSQWKTIDSVQSSYQLHFKGIGWFQMSRRDELLAGAIEQDVKRLASEVSPSEIAMSAATYDEQGVLLSVSFVHQRGCLNLDFLIDTKNYITVWHMYRRQRRAIQGRG